MFSVEQVNRLRALCGSRKTVQSVSAREHERALTRTTQARFTATHTHLHNFTRTRQYINEWVIFFFFLTLAVLFVAITALVRAHSNWARLRSRRNGTCERMRVTRAFGWIPHAASTARKFIGLRWNLKSSLPRQCVCVCSKLFSISHMRAYMVRMYYVSQCIQPDSQRTLRTSWVVHTFENAIQKPLCAHAIVSFSSRMLPRMVDGTAATLQQLLCCATTFQHTIFHIFLHLSRKCANVSQTFARFSSTDRDFASKNSKIWQIRANEDDDYEKCRRKCVHQPRFFYK